MGEGSGRGRVGSGQTFCRQSRVGSGWVNVSPGRVQESDPWTTLLSPLRTAEVEFYPNAKCIKLSIITASNDLLYYNTKQI